MIDFKHAQREAGKLRNERSCSLFIKDEKLLVGDIPYQFTMIVSCTKAAKKRGQYAKALGQFTQDNWYAVILEQEATLYGQKAKELVFSMNPTFRKHIENNLDEYRYKRFMFQIKDWDRGFTNLQMNPNLFTTYLGWTITEQIEIIIKKHLYDRLDECGSFDSALCWLIANNNKILNNGQPSALPECYTPSIRSHLIQAQNILCSVLGHPPTPRVTQLEEVLLSHIS
jgi:hypothetical protein